MDGDEKSVLWQNSEPKTVPGDLFTPHPPGGLGILPNFWRVTLFLFSTDPQKWLHTSYEPLPDAAWATPSACFC